MSIAGRATFQPRRTTGLALLLLLSCTSAEAANEAASLEVVPATVEGRLVARDAPVEVWVRLKAGDQDLSGITLSTFSNDDIELDEKNSTAHAVDKLPCGTEQVWKLKLVPRNSDALAAASMSTIVAVAFKEGKTNPRQRYLFQTVKITAPASDGPTLDVNPSTVEGRIVAAAEPIYVQVRLKAGHNDLADVMLSTFSNDHVSATIEGGGPSAATVGRLPAEAEHSWKLRVIPDSGATLAPASLNVHVAVTFKQGKEIARPRYLFQTVKIASPSAVSIAALADVEVKGSLESVSHERPGQMFVIVTNKHSRPVKVTDIQVNASNYLTPDGPGAKEFQVPSVSTIGIGEVKVFPFKMTPTEQIVPGKYPVVVVVSLKSPDGVSASTTKTQDIDLTVLGESDLLSKLGVPSLLFLPGVLFLLTWQLLWSHGKDAAARQAYQMTPTSGAFWVIAVVLSIISGIAYPLAMALFGQKRDYLAAYGLYDYMYVFAGTIVVATVSFGLWRVAQWLGAQIRASIASRFAPNETDSPIDILWKSGQLGVRIMVPLAQGTDPAQRFFVMDFWSEASFLWIVPPAVLEVQGDPPTDALNLVQGIAKGEVVDARTLASRLKEGIEKKWWTVQWGTVGAINGPRRVPAASWTVLDARAPYVEVSE
jgi:hypothetical protein